MNVSAPCARQAMVKAGIIGDFSAKGTANRLTCVGEAYRDAFFSILLSRVLDQYFSFIRTMTYSDVD